MNSIKITIKSAKYHMLTIPMNYTSFGGTYTIATGVNAGSQVFGQDPLWLACFHLLFQVQYHP